MTTDLVKPEDRDLVRVLANSHYPGASEKMIALAISYCRAANLDPMLKPVHIVSIWDSAAGCMREVIMPGIALYRIQAARSGEYAGISEPEFGPPITARPGGKELTFPEWCRVTVRRRVGGHIAEFTALEFWLENYASKKGGEANSMWSKRPFGQLAKVAEAQALRRAFPEFSSATTAEEMEGKEINMGDAVRVEEPVKAPEPPVKAPEPIAVLPLLDDERFSKNIPAWRAKIESGERTAEQLMQSMNAKFSLTEKQLAAIKALEPLQQAQQEIEK